MRQGGEGRLWLVGWGEHVVFLGSVWDAVHEGVAVRLSGNFGNSTFGFEKELGVGVLRGRVKKCGVLIGAKGGGPSRRRKRVRNGTIYKQDLYVGVAPEIFPKFGGWGATGGGRLACGLLGGVNM